MKLRQLSIILYIIGVPSYAQVNYNVNAYSMSLSGATTSSTGGYSLTENQGGLAFFRKTALVINYSNRYLIRELTTQSLDYIMPVGKATAGISVSYFGDRALNESCYSLAYGRQLYQWLGAGIKMNYHYLAIEDIDNHASAVTGELGIQAFPIEGLCVGVHVKNPTKSRFITLNCDELYSGFKAGISYSEHELFNLTSQYNWDNFEESNLAIAGEWWLLKSFTVRAGVKVRKNPSWSCGTGLKYRRFLLDLGFERHTVLGLSAAVSIIYQIKGDAS